MLRMNDDKIKQLREWAMVCYLRNRKFLLSLFCFSVFYALAFNWWVIDLYSGFGLASGVVSALSSIVMCFGVMLMLWCHWSVFFAALWALTMFFAFRVWFLKFSGLEFDDELLASIMETKSQEVMIYLNFLSVSAFLVIGAGCWLITMLLRRINRSTFRNRIPLVAAGFALVTLVNVVWYRGMVYNTWFPDVVGTVSFSKAAKFPFFQVKEADSMIDNYFSETKQVIHELSQLKDPALQESSCTQHDPLIVVIHVGESLRPDRLSINGFSRNTTPLLSKRKGLISFPKVLSYGTNTRVSIMGMLSDATVDSRKLTYTSFISLYNKHGYRTKGFTLKGGSLHDMPAKKLLSSLQENMEFGHKAGEMYDVMSMLPAITQAIREGADRKMFFYINNIGNHPGYYYHPDSRVFTPDERNISFPHLYPVENIENAYDNATVQNDRFINAVMDQLEGANAIYFYCSDHGQSLGENGHFTQGGDMDIPQQRYVACFIWASPRFIRQHPDMYKTIEQNARRLPLISHDHFYHTSISLGGIKSEIQQPQRDLASPLAEPWQGDAPPWPAYDQQLETYREKGGLRLDTIPLP